jgi:hypothetical protein
MCWHKRFVFFCNHFSFGDEVKACDIQRAFDDGTSEVVCDTMFSHPLHSRRFGQVCSDCEKKKVRTSANISKLKEILRELDQTMQRVQHKEEQDEKSPAGSDDEEAVVTA